MTHTHTKGPETHPHHSSSGAVCACKRILFHHLIVLTQKSYPFRCLIIQCKKNDLHKLLHHFVTVILIKHNYIWRCNDRVRDNGNKKEENVVWRNNLSATFLISFSRVIRPLLDDLTLNIDTPSSNAINGSDFIRCMHNWQAVRLMCSQCGVQWLAEGETFIMSSFRG